MLKMQKLLQRSRHKRSAPGRGAAAAASTALVSSVADYSQFAAAVAQKQTALQHAKPQNLRSKYLERVSRRRSSAVGDTGASIHIQSSSSDSDSNRASPDRKVYGGTENFASRAEAPLLQQLRAYYIAPSTAPSQSPPQSPPPSPLSSPPSPAPPQPIPTAVSTAKAVKATSHGPTNCAGENIDGASQHDAADAAADAKTDVGADDGSTGESSSIAHRDREGEAKANGTVTKPSLKTVATAAIVAVQRPNEMYSDINLLRRESLKFDPHIVGLMHELWSVSDVDADNVITQREYFAVFVRVHSALAYDTCAEIRALYTAAPKSGGVIDIGNNDGNSHCNGDVTASANDRSDTECASDTSDADYFPPQIDQGTREMLRKNFASDSDGSETLDRTLFTTALFQLADKWTEHIDLHDYRSFLQDILDCISICKSKQETSTSAGAAYAQGHHACVVVQSHTSAQLPRARPERVLRDHADVIALAELRRRRCKIDGTGHEDSDSSTSTVFLADDDDDLNCEGSRVANGKDGDLGVGTSSKLTSGPVGRRRSHAGKKRDDKSRKKLWRSGPGMQVKHAPSKRYCTNSRLARLAIPRPHTSVREAEGSQGTKPAKTSDSLCGATPSAAAPRRRNPESTAHREEDDSPVQRQLIRGARARRATAGSAASGSGGGGGGETPKLRRSSVAASNESPSPAGSAPSSSASGEGNGSTAVVATAAAASRACRAPRSGQVHSAYARSRPKRLPPLPTQSGRDRVLKQQPLSSQGNNAVHTETGISTQPFDNYPRGSNDAVATTSDAKDVGIKSSAEKQLDAAMWMGGKGGVRMAGLEAGFVMRSGTAAGMRAGGAGASAGANARVQRACARPIHSMGARQSKVTLTSRASAGAEPRQQRQRQLQRRVEGTEQRASAVVVRSGARGSRTIMQI